VLLVHTKVAYMELKVFKFLSLLLLATPSLAGRLAKKPQMGRYFNLPACFG
jgi:hypothetical protein